MNIQQLFPIPVGFVDLPRPLTESELEFIKNQEQRANMGNTSSEDSYICKKSKISFLTDFFTHSVNNYFRQVCNPKADLQLYITQSWINYTQKNQYHHKHAHPNSLISGVFYVDTDPEKDRIYFYKSQSWQQIKYEIKDYNLFNSESWWYEARPNSLIIFPSYLEHNVENLGETERTRISISFNTWTKGTIGSAKELTELIL